MSRPGETPNAARVYDYVLNGEDEARYSLPADRAFARALIAADPGAVERTRRNRQFVLAAARMAAKDGIRQFLDLGAGFPAEPSVHSAVRDITRVAGIVAVDIDPIVAAAWNSAAIPGVTAVQADISRPESLLPWLPLDMSQPAVAIFGSVLHLIGDSQRVVKEYKATLAPGSWLVVSVINYRSDERIAWTQALAGMSVRNHSAEDLAEMFSGMQIAGPGIVEARCWTHGICHGPRGRNAVTLVGVAKKPR
jgi:SAM-dependent methyltransferase